MYVLIIALVKTAYKLNANRTSTEKNNDEISPLTLTKMTAGVNEEHSKNIFK